MLVCRGRHWNLVAFSSKSIIKSRKKTKKERILDNQGFPIIPFITSYNAVMQWLYALVQAFNSNFILRTLAKSAEILASQKRAAFREVFSCLYDCS